MREGLRRLEEEKGDLKQLEADLTGYARLRVGSYRVIIRFYADRLERPTPITGCTRKTRDRIRFLIFKSR